MEVMIHTIQDRELDVGIKKVSGLSSLAGPSLKLPLIHWPNLQKEGEGRRCKQESGLGSGATPSIGRTR